MVLLFAPAVTSTIAFMCVACFHFYRVWWGQYVRPFGLPIVLMLVTNALNVTGGFFSITRVFGTASLVAWFGALLRSLKGDRANRCLLDLSHMALFLFSATVVVVNPQAYAAVCAHLAGTGVAVALCAANGRKYVCIAAVCLFVSTCGLVVEPSLYAAYPRRVVDVAMSVYYALCIAGFLTSLLKSYRHRLQDPSDIVRGIELERTSAPFSPQIAA
jgi:hypothetical protein